MSLPAAFRDRLRLPVIGSPLFIASTPELVIEQCKAGIIGSFPGAERAPGSRARRMAHAHPQRNWTSTRPRTRGAKVAPFAVNQIAHASNDRLQHDMDACVRHQVPLIITSLRPPREIVDAAHSYGGLVFHDVISVRHARKAVEQGVDGIIVVCAGAGGHAGMGSPVRARARNPPVLRRHAGARRRHVERRGRACGAGDRRRHGLHRHAVPGDDRGPRPARVQADARRLDVPTTSSTRRSSPA